MRHDLKRRLEWAVIREILRDVAAALLFVAFCIIFSVALIHIIRPIDWRCWLGETRIDCWSGTKR